MTDRIDDELRNIQLPPGMLDRLRDQPRHASHADWASATDHDLDAALAEVTVPRYFTNDLRTALWEGIEVDRQLRDVEVSGWFLARLRTIASPTESRWKQTVRTLAAAAALLMVVAAYGLAMFDVFQSIRENESAIVETEFLYEGPIDFSPAVASADIQFTALPIQEPTDMAIEIPSELFVTTPIEIEPANLFEPPEASPQDLLSQLVHGYEPDTDWVILKSGVFGSADHTDDYLPSFLPPPLPPAVGVQPPLSRYVDRRFLLLNHSHPIIAINNRRALSRVDVPLNAATPFYDRIMSELSFGRPPQPADIRVDEFINAIGPSLAPAATDSLSLTTSLGPSPFHHGDSHLLLIGAQAGKTSRTTSATHFTIALDTSASMKWNGRLQNAKAAIERLAGVMSPDDRLTLVQFGDRATTLLEFITRDDLPFLQAVLDELQPGGGASLGAGVQQGVSAAMLPQASGLRKQLVVVTDDDTQTDELSQEMADMLGAVSQFSLNVNFVHLGDNQQPLGAIANFGVTVQQPNSKSQLVALLIESLTGRSADVANDVNVSLNFDPKKVNAWRLVGHDPSIFNDTNSSSHRTMVALDSACMLVEVWLKEDAGGQFASASVGWLEPRTGVRRQIQRPVSVGQLAPSFAESTRSLRSASLAAEAAEILRQSPFATTRDGDLRGVLKKSLQVSGRLANEREFIEFMQLLKSIQGLAR